ncbi:MAG: DUF1684 domain-containing protein [Candidatus Heimdallarchaeota archaeon]|nr:DUF1684 domain-containing protein [Candidatus Heimdallarchaeota archaeon]MBY8994195.1 DUF1684 domain-containing protein [Candidatus Heimdallarchaeota archaeon]
MSYEEEIMNWRQNRERNLNEGIMIGDMLWSPVPEDERKNLKLNFFPIDANYKFDAKITLLESKKERTFSKEDGTPSDPFLETGYVEFKHKNENIRLFFVFDEQTNGYYIAFRDSTCGKESYPNGRLLLIENVDQETIILDFNKAFNFACAYNETLSCPVTPPDNWLSFTIEAGEKVFK